MKMDQLMQRELLELEDVLHLEALAVKKCRMYAESCAEKELRPLFEEAARMHSEHLSRLIRQLGQHDGRKQHH
jgi:hypothetical protein